MMRLPTRFKDRVPTHAGLVLGIALAVLAAAPSAAQEAPEFEVDMVTVRPSGARTSQVDIYTKIPLARLRFLSSPEGFTARYEVALDLVQLDEDGNRANIVQSPLWERTVRVPNYADTQSDRFDFSTHSIEGVDPGPYVFEVQILDKSSNESFVHEETFHVKDVSKQSAMSGVLVLQEFDQETNTIYPSVSRKITNPEEGLLLFYELYLDEPREVVFKREVMRVDGGPLPSLRAPATNRATSENDSNSGILYTDDERSDVETTRSQHIVTLPVGDLAVGTYQVIVQVADVSGILLDYADATFEVVWGGLREHISDIDDAISQLQYIAKRRDIRFLQGAPDEGAKWDRFREFWERRDPTPGTARNEQMEEYYYRVAYANRQYSSIEDGWRTDRGQVVVLYGEPDIVERHPYNFSVSPYEVWFYYRIGRRFIFVDKTGLGDYQLLVPIWDETTRLR